jgi:hypothetical protein
MNSNKQQIHLIAYASSRFKTRSNYFNNEVSKNNCFNTVKVFNENDLTPSFVEKFQDVLSLPRGAGYWLWKWDIINQTLNTINDNDIVIYTDAGCHVNINEKTINRFNEYINLVNEHDILRFQLAHKEYVFTNKATLRYFKEKYNLQKEHALSNQLMATVIIMKKCPRVVKFFNEFKNIIEADRFLITDKYNDDRCVGFVDHRHDQSIFSLLSKALNIGYIIPDETWYEDWSRTEYSPFVASRCAN